jgi:hypothetical protein
MIIQRILEVPTSLFGVAALVAALAGCGSESAPPRRDAAGGDGGADSSISTGSDAGIPIGGSTLPPAGDAEMPPFTTDAPYVVVNGSSCPVTLSIADPTGDETTALLLGDTPPLSAPSGVRLTWAAGRWSAQVALPLETLVSYRFYFGKKPIDYGLPGDDGGTIDGDAGTSEPGDDAGPEMVDDYRWSSEVPTRTDWAGDTWNVFAPVLNCQP